MKVFRTLFLLVMLAGLGATSCRDTKTENEHMREAALSYYGHLIAGEYDQCVDAIVYKDSMTEEYRAQMIDVMAQYAEREKQRTGGMVSVRVLADTLLEDVGHVFLEAVYADSTSEEISLPMVLSEDGWKIQ